MDGDDPSGPQSGPVTYGGDAMPVSASRRFVLGTALITAAAAKGAAVLNGIGDTADPYVSGRVLRGAGTRTTVLDPTDSAFGARGDGVLLTDLTVQAGSTTVSSASAPFVSTERDRGKLVVWRTVGDETGSGIVDSVRSPTEAVLRAPAAAASRADGGPNTNGAVGTDNTAALDSAFASAQAASARAGADRRRRVPVPEVRLPRGVFLLTALKPFTQPGVTVAGEGRFSTILASVSEGGWMQLSPFRPSPSDAYQGTAIDWTFRDLQFVNPAFGSTSSEGRRRGRAIQDNGSGGVRIVSCSFQGLEYGFCGAHGSDFSEIRESTFDNCDVGYYFGPGSQQVEITKTDAASCREGAVFEGAPHWHLGGASSFEDPSVAAITIEAKASGRTRLGVPVNLSGAFYSGKFLIDGATWFETNSGSNGRLVKRMILVRGDGPFGVPVEGVVIRDALVVAGGDQQQGGTNAFLELDTDRVSPEPVVIEDLVMGGQYFNSVFRMSGKAETSSPRLIGITVPDAVRLTQGRAGAAKILRRDGSSSGTMRLRALDDAAPVLAVQGPDGDAVVSGIAGGGALLEAFVSAESDGGAVRLDATAANYWSCTLRGGAAVLQITNPPEGVSQRLTVELVAAGGARTVRWPPECRFTGGSGPASVATGTRTSVTFAWHPAQRVWVETGRATGVAV